MQPPPGYENKDEDPNRYKVSKLIITRDDALSALRIVFSIFLWYDVIRSVVVTRNKSYFVVQYYKYWLSVRPRTPFMSDVFKWHVKS